MKFWVELGAMIMLQKPIVVVAVEGRPIPPKLRAIADEIVTSNSGFPPASELEAAIRRVSGDD